MWIIVYILYQEPRKYPLLRSCCFNSTVLHLYRIQYVVHTTTAYMLSIKFINNDVGILTARLLNSKYFLGIHIHKLLLVSYTQIITSIIHNYVFDTKNRMLTRILLLRSCCFNPTVLHLYRIQYVVHTTLHICSQ